MSWPYWPALGRGFNVCGERTGRRGGYRIQGGRKLTGRHRRLRYSRRRSLMSLLKLLGRSMSLYCAG